MARLATIFLALMWLVAVPRVRADATRCVGDCDDTGEVTVRDLIDGLNIALGTTALEKCPSLDANGNGFVTVDELVTAVGNALNGCPAPFNPDTCTTAPSVSPDVLAPLTWDATYATVDPSDPQTTCGCAHNSHSAWFALTPSGNGIAHINTLTSNYDTVLALFTGTCGASDLVMCNDDAGSPQSRLDLPVTAGTSYLIEVASRCDTDGGPLRVAIDICGDGIVTAGEECDDGNLTGGDGCDSQCHFEGLGGIDQSWMGPTGICGSGTTELNIQYAEPIGQQFVPTQPLLGAVDVLLTDLGGGSVATDTLTLRIKKGTIDAPATASVSIPVTLQRPSWQHFSLDPPVAVVPNETYVVELASANGFFGWTSIIGDGDVCTVVDYPRGHPIAFGEEQPRQAFVFRTYAGLPPS